MTKQPNSNYLINELIKLGRFETAMAKAEENEKFFDKKADEQRDLYHQAAIGFVRKRA